MTLYLSSAGRFKGRFLALDLTTRTLSLLARLVGVTVALASVWASHGAWVDGMELCQRGVHAPIRLRTQHGGWYVGILANGLAFVSGAFAVLFGRGNVLGPTNNQLAMASIDERQFASITPANLGPYQVGLTPRGERVMRTPRPATFSEAHRAIGLGAFTRVDVDDEEIAMTAREYGVGTTGGVWARGDAEAGGAVGDERWGGGGGRHWAASGTGGGGARRGGREGVRAGGRRRPRRAARRRQTGLGGVQGAVLEVANLALPRGSGRWFGSKVRPGGREVRGGTEPAGGQAREHPRAVRVPAW